MSASISLADAVTITGATTGKAITEKEVTAGPLTTAQRTALVNFITSMGPGWPGGPGNILAVSVFRNASNQTQIMFNARGLIVYADLATAAATMNARTEEFVGVVP